MKRVRACKIERSHIRDCAAFKQAGEEGGGPFLTLAPFGDAVFCNAFANPNVRRGRHYLYIRVRCNDTHCPATALVNLDAALRAVGLNFEAP